MVKKIKCDNWKIDLLELVLDVVTVVELVDWVIVILKTVYRNNILVKCQVRKYFGESVVSSVEKVDDDDGFRVLKE